MEEEEDLFKANARRRRSEPLNIIPFLCFRSRLASQHYLAFRIWDRVPHVSQRSVQYYTAEWEPGQWEPS